MCNCIGQYAIYQPIKGDGFDTSTVGIISDMFCRCLLTSELGFGSGKLPINTCIQPIVGITALQLMAAPANLYVLCEVMYMSHTIKGRI